MRLVVFEDDHLGWFGPLTLLRHASSLRWGTKPLYESLLAHTGGTTEVSLWGRKHVAPSVRSVGRGYNAPVQGEALLVNSRAKPDNSLLSITARKTPFVAVSGRHLLAARLDLSDVRPGVIKDRTVTGFTKKVETLEAPESSLFQGYWNLLEGNGLAVAEGVPVMDDTQPLPQQTSVKGPGSNIHIHGKAEVEPHVLFDARLGPVIVDEGASVEAFSRLMGPCYVGKRVKLFSATIGGGTSVFDHCKVGGQVEDSVIGPYTNKAHLGYVGDSYVGEWVNLGAGCNFSNLKNTYGNVRVESGRATYDTGMVKLGPAVGDMCKVSIGAMLFAGKSMGAGSHLTGLTQTNIPPFTFFDGFRGSGVELLLDSVVETQRRMMERRGLTLMSDEEDSIRFAFRATAADRRKAGVRKGRLRR